MSRSACAIGKGISGVYAIINCITGKAYIGQSKDIGHRWCSHQYDLKTGRHGCSHLQRAWKKHGADAFSLKVLVEITDKQEKTRLEQHWMDWYRDHHGLYNSRPAADSMLGYVFTPEQRAKAATGMLGKTHKPETIAKMKATAAGRVISAEQRAKISVTVKKTMASVESRSLRSKVHMGQAAHNKGKPMPEDQRAKLSASVTEWMADPVNREKVRLATKQARDADPSILIRVANKSREAMAKPEVRRKISNSINKLWDNPEYRAKHKAAMANPEVRRKMSLARKRTVELKSGSTNV